MESVQRVLHALLIASLLHGSLECARVRHGRSCCGCELCAVESCGSLRLEAGDTLTIAALIGHREKSTEKGESGRRGEGARHEKRAGLWFGEEI